MQIKKNISLVLGILIPIFMIVFITATIYLPPLLPGIFPQPQYNFLYLASGAYNAEPYVIQDGKLVPKQLPQGAYQTDSNKPDKIFIYDVKQNKSKEITLELAQVVNLDGNVKSPDGFTITTGGNGLFAFDMGSDAPYLKGPYFSRKLDIPSYNNGQRFFRFIGWIKHSDSR